MCGEHRPAHAGDATGSSDAATGASALEHPPRRDTRLAPDDDAYLVGPSAELLEILRHDRQSGGGAGGAEPA